MNYRPLSWLVASVMMMNNVVTKRSYTKIKVKGPKYPCWDTQILFVSSVGQFVISVQVKVQLIS